MAQKTNKPVSETVQSEVYNYKASDDNNDDKTEPEWGVKSFNLNKQTGNFNITVTAGKERYPDTKIYVALYRNGVLVSVKSFVPEFDSNSEYSGDGTMSLPSDMTNISAKAFIWHGEKKDYIGSNCYGDVRKHDTCTVNGLC